MINFDLQKVVSTAIGRNASKELTQRSLIHYTVSNISVSRIGDVVFLDKNMKTDISLEDYIIREPWKHLFQSDNIEIIGGSLLGTVNNSNIIRFKANNFSLDRMMILFNYREINLSILQNHNKLSLCILNGYFCGNKINYNENIFDFIVNKSEMIYNK